MDVLFLIDRSSPMDPDMIGTKCLLHNLTMYIDIEYRTKVKIKYLFFSISLKYSFDSAISSLIYLWRINSSNFQIMFLSHHLAHATDFVPGFWLDNYLLKPTSFIQNNLNLYWLLTVTQKKFSYQTQFSLNTVIPSQRKRNKLNRWFIKC